MWERFIHQITFRFRWTNRYVGVRTDHWNSYHLQKMFITPCEIQCAYQLRDIRGSGVTCSGLENNLKHELFVGK